MRIALLSDVHGNYEALQVVLAEVKRLGIDTSYSLGDAVGYGPEPEACVETLRRETEVSLLGNHDAAVVGRTSTDDFNDNARWAVEWTRNKLTQDSIEYLSKLPYLHRGEDLQFVHASPLQPQDWHYIQGPIQAELAFAHFTERACFIGHTHCPYIMAREDDDGIQVYESQEAELEPPNRRFLVNVGSVGQPRDRDPRASFAILDTGLRRVEIRRVAYQVEKVQSLMRENEMPHFLIQRLPLGM